MYYVPGIDQDNLPSSEWTKRAFFASRWRSRGLPQPLSSKVPSTLEQRQVQATDCRVQRHSSCDRDLFSLALLPIKLPLHVLLLTNTVTTANMHSLIAWNGRYDRVKVVILCRTMHRNDDDYLITSSANLTLRSITKNMDFIILDVWIEN